MHPRWLTLLAWPILVAGLSQAVATTQPAVTKSKPNLFSWCQNALSRYRESRELRALEKSFAPLERNSEIKIRQNEIRHPVGRLANGPQDLAHLPDGDYVFLVDQEGRLGFSDRAPDEKSGAVPGEHLATHRSLELFFQTLSIAPPRIVAAGTFAITNGRVREVSNQAGTFIKNNDQSRLDYSVRKLQKFGLALESKTARRLASRDNALKYDHASESEIAELTHKYRGTVVYVEAASAFKMLAENFPDPSVPGNFDIDAVLDLANKIDAELNERPTPENIAESHMISDGVTILNYLQGSEFGVAYVLSCIFSGANGSSAEGDRIFFRSSMSGIRLIVSRSLMRK